MRIAANASVNKTILTNMTDGQFVYRAKSFYIRMHLFCKQLDITTEYNEDRNEHYHHSITYVGIICVCISVHVIRAGMDGLCAGIPARTLPPLC